MRIAMISTPYVPVPPPRYGGTELVVGELCEGLRERGHHVTLFTVGDDDPKQHVRSLYHRPVWPPDPFHEANHAAWAIGEVIGSDLPFDVIHAHVPTALPLKRFTAAPMIYTLHHERDEALTALYALAGRGTQLVAVSDRQRALLPEVSEIERVYHGLDPERYALGHGGGPAVFLGRLAREKAPHVAIDVARRARAPLVIAGAAHWEDREYFDAEVAPRLGGDGVMWIGEVGLAEKVPLLARASALLFPIDWEEPFGLVMVEAMFAGTPVIARSRGSVPEVVDEGVTGFVCRDAEEMAARLVALAAGGFDRAACRARAIERFGRARMVDDYLAVYRRALGVDARDPASRESGGIATAVEGELVAAR